MTVLLPCEIINIVTLSESTLAFDIKADTIAEHALPGQFISIRCGEERILRRPISIASVKDGILRFVFEIRGAGTEWLSKRMPGELIDLLGPLGNPYTIPKERYIVIGGGIGAPPVLFAAKSELSDCVAILGFRDKSKIILEEEFRAICSEVYITTDDGSSGIHGTVTKPLVSLLETGGYSAVLACGPRGMLSAIAELCKSYDTPCQVSLEERMGCGVGACLVCTCKTVKSGEEQMKRVCKDGPVFDAQEVSW